jgi:hypothetical protein
MNINADWIERNVEFRWKSSTPTPTP